MFRLNISRLSQCGEVVMVCQLNASTITSYRKLRTCQECGHASPTDI